MDCIDEYTHESPQIMYFPQSIPTREVEETIVPSNVFCQCTETCREHSNCACIRNSGTFYSFPALKDVQNYVLTYKNVNMPTYECNEHCQCKNIVCGNKLVQCGPRKGLKIRPCHNSAKGKGLFTERHIKSGNFICEYAGEVISEGEASVRYKKNTQLNRMNYIFCIDERFGEKNVKTFIDPTFYGNIGRYVNHSCEPNCNMIVTRTNTNIPMLGLFAHKDIEVGEELCYDYGPSSSEKCEENTMRIKCQCDSKMCRGFLPYDSRFM